MKALGITSTAVLSLLLAIAGPAWAQEQHEQEQKDKPAQQEEQKAQPEKSTKQAQKPAAQQDKAVKPEEKAAQPEEKSAKPEEKAVQLQEKAVQPQEKAAQPKENNAAQRTTQAQPDKQVQHASGGRIPDDRYKVSFGEQHTFRVSQGDYGNRRFQYGGYSFGFVDAWPSEWLYTQNVYVVEIDGVYYLCNPMYPGVNIALVLTL